MHKYMHKFEPVAVPTTVTESSLQENTTFRRLLAQARLGSESCLASVRILREKTAEKTEDEWSAIDVRKLNKQVSKVMMSNPVVIFQPVCLQEGVVVTTCFAIRT